MSIKIMLVSGCKASKQSLPVRLFEQLNLCVLANRVWFLFWNGQVHSSLNLWCPAFWLLDYDWRKNLHWRLDDSDWKGDAVTIARLIPSVMLDEATQNVANLNYLTVYWGWERIYVWYRGLILKSVVSWNIDNKFSLQLFMSSASFHSNRWNCRITPCWKTLALVSLAYMFAGKYEQEVFNSFITIRIITDNFAVNFLANVIFFSIKNNIWLALSCSYAKKASNFIR